MRRSGRHGQRGAVAVLVAVVLIVLGAFLALGMNIGHSRMVRGQLQNAADAAALAGAKDLDGTLTPILNQLPNASATDFAGRHVSDRAVTVGINPTSDVVLGTWDPFGADPATSFTPVTATTLEDARNVNAVRVLTGREASRGNPLDVFFATFLGNPNKTEVTADAIAVNGGPCTEDCPNVPLAFFACGLIDPVTNELQCGKTLRIHFSPDGSDTGGLSSLSTASASTTIYRDIISAENCANYNFHIGDSVNISNGQQGSTTLCGPEKNQPTFDRFCVANAAGTCTQQPIVRAPIVDGTCPPKFNQTHKVVGVASFKFVTIVCGGTGAYMDIELVCNQVDDSESVYGCGWWGTGPTQPKLVR